jgi:glycopeptide antibiotics resistance protein
MKKMNRFRKRGIFFLYCMVIVFIILMKGSLEFTLQTLINWNTESVLKGIETANLLPFQTIQLYAETSNRILRFSNVYGNIGIFIPFGILLPYAYEKTVKFGTFLSYTFVAVAGIEVSQVFSTLGIFDVDDILLNCFGSVLGYFIYHLCFLLVRLKRNK